VCVANACCTPLTCAAAGAACGVVPNGCGGTLSCGACGAGQACVANACVASPGAAVYDATFRAPRCATASAWCDSGAQLVGRGPLGPEPGAPNTLGSACADGTSGSFHADESLDGLRISSLDGGPLTAGRPARIEARVWAYSGYSSDKLDLYVAADARSPAWTFLGTLTPTAAGAQTLALQLTLPTGDVQAIRGRFRYGGSASACTTGSYDDHDDLVFAAEMPEDVAAPVVSLTAPLPGATVSGTVPVTATASDDIAVARVELLDGATPLGTALAPPYQVSWNTRAAANGPHVLTAVAWDRAGKSATASIDVVVANDVTPPVVALLSPTAGASLAGTVALAASASDDVGVVKVEYLDGASVVATSSAAPFGASWSTLSAANGAHALAARAYDAAGNVATSAAVPVTVANGAVVATATYDAARRVPACAAPSSGCDSGTLVNGRGPLGPEPGAPNTLASSCADGASGAYHADESIDRVRVVAVDGGALAAGKLVRVEVTVWAWSSADKLDVYFAPSAASPAWTLAGTVAAPAKGVYTLSVTYPLPAGAFQAVRAAFRYGGSASPCSTGPFDDRDDLAFAVQ
jgi:hypothetical protein